MKTVSAFSFIPKSTCYNTNGYDNTANGTKALYSNTSGNDNTAYGEGALSGNSTGNNNLGMGNHAGAFLTTGDNNIDIGNYGMTGESGIIRIGTTGTNTATFIAGISGVTVTNTARPVVIDPNTGQLGIVDISTLVGPTGATGATGPQGSVGATGATGSAGTNGVDGAGLITGAYLYLPSTKPAPSGFTKIGTTTQKIRNLLTKVVTLNIAVYQKN